MAASPYLPESQATTEVVRTKPSKMQARVQGILTQRPWVAWVFVYIVGALYFMSYRCVAMWAIRDMFADKKKKETGAELAGLLLGAFEDVLWLTYLLLLLWVIDAVLHRCGGKAFANRVNRRPVNVIQLREVWRHLSTGTKTSSVMVLGVRGLLILLTLLIGVIPFAADMVLMRTRQMRFTFMFLTMYFNEKDAAGAVEIDKNEVAIALWTIGVSFAVVITIVSVSVMYMDYSKWNPTKIVWGCVARHSQQATRKPNVTGETSVGDVSTDHYTSLDDGTPTTDIENPTINGEAQAAPPKPKRSVRIIVNTFVILIVLVIFPIIVMAVSRSVTFFVASIGLNTSQNEMFRVIFRQQFLPTPTSGKLESAEYYLDRSENYTLFAHDVLYRNTTGFNGPLAFDVAVNKSDPPNVLVLVVESFRYHDSQYLVANNTYLLKEKNISITPNFDRWAKRGIGFHSFWSSWRTSRSLESVLFGQLPYDSVTDSGTTGGRKGLKLSGMPQFFKQKGYEPAFTTGCRVDYDQWYKFLPSHGFDEIISMKEFKKLAEKDLGVDPNDWKIGGNGKARAMSYWGVHDDLALQVLGNIMTNKTDEQRARVARGEPKKPFFINHYTISSHTPFYDRPDWYRDYPDMPDFSDLYKGEKYSKQTQRYLEMRYFEDMALGKFLDRMSEQGILNDTIVVIMGDHGQGPEYGLDVPEAREISATRIAATLIAEGRLGKYAGMMYNAVAEQYDMLNTLADIVGVPSEGFIQSGVGRSLKRVGPDDRVVWTNNPSRKMAYVQGDLRYVYARDANAMSVYNIEKDHDQKHDLYSTMSPAELSKALDIRTAGRRLNQYFKDRIEGECILSVAC